MNRRMIVPAIMLSLGIAMPAIADTLIIEETVTKPAEIGPKRGSSMDQVERNFGQPGTSYQPVGDPPITRWEYPDFVVYFEYQYVIHSVAKHKAG